MPRFSPMLAAAVTAALVATGPADALPLRPAPEAAPADAQVGVQTVDHRRWRHHRRSGGVHFSFGFGSPFYEPYGYGFGPRVYSYDPYYYRHYEPYYEPAPYVYETQPYVYEPAPRYGSDTTGRCDAGQVYRYPIGCVPS